MNKLYFFFVSVKVALGATTLIWAITLAHDTKVCPARDLYNNLPNLLITGFIIDGTILVIVIVISRMCMQNFTWEQSLQYSSFPLMPLNIYTIVMLAIQFTCTTYTLWIIAIIDHSVSVLFHSANIGNYCFERKGFYEELD